MGELDAALAQGSTAAAPFASRVAWGVLALGTELSKCALFPRVER
jgi:hypothetical protein